GIACACGAILSPPRDCECDVLLLGGRVPAAWPRAQTQAQDRVARVAAHPVAASAGAFPPWAHPFGWLPDGEHVLNSASKRARRRRSASAVLFTAVCVACTRRRPDIMLNPMTFTSSAPGWRIRTLVPASRSLRAS